MLKDEGIDRRIHIGEACPWLSTAREVEYAVGVYHRAAEGLTERREQRLQISDYERLRIVGILYSVIIVICISIIANGVSVRIQRLIGIRGKRIRIVTNTIAISVG